MKNSFWRGIIEGLIFTLLISSICDVTVYGLEGVIADSLTVFGINLVFMIISVLIVYFLKKFKVYNKISLISNILLILFGILIVISIFYGKIDGIISVDYMMPGTTVKVPNMLWLMVLLCVTIRNVCVDEKHGLLKFIIGELIAVIILSMVDFALCELINVFNNGAIYLSSEINDFNNKAINLSFKSNTVIRGIGGCLIVVYSLYMAKKCVDDRNEKART